MHPPPSSHSPPPSSSSPPPSPDSLRIKSASCCPSIETSRIPCCTPSSSCPLVPCAPFAPQAELRPRWALTLSSSTLRWVAITSVIFLMSSWLLPPVIAAGGKANFRQMEKKILDTIIGGGRYDSRIRPSGANGSDTDGPAVIRVNVYIRSISRIDDVTMEYSVQITFREQWNDDRLVYDDLQGQIRYLTLTDPDKIWKPDLFFSNEKEGHFHDIIMPNVLLRIHPDGSVLYSIRISLVLACPMDLKYYPLDKQTCIIKMASYGYTTEDVVFLWKNENPVQVTKELHLPRFTLKRSVTDYCTSRTNTGEYSCVVVNLIFKREFSYYLIQIYIPCIMLVIVSWVSFWLDPNAIPARVSLGVTTLLTMATQISGINASLPPVSYTKAIDVWTGVCLTFVFGALLEFALVNYASRSDAHRAAFKKKQEQQQQELQQVLASNVPSNQGWDLEAGFDFENQVENVPASYVMPVMRMGRVGNHHQTGGAGFPPLMPSGPMNPLLGRGGAPMLSPGLSPPPIGGGAGSAGASMSQKLRGCELHAPPSTDQNWLSKWLNSFPTRSKRIDVISRIFFPIMFGMFNVVYWTTYTLRDDLKYV